MDRQAYFALDLVPQNLIFTYMTPYQKIYFTKFYACHFSKENWSGLLFLNLGGGGGDVNQWTDRDVPILLSIWYPKI